MKKDTAISNSTLSAQGNKPVDITKRITHVDKKGRVSFEYPKHFTMAQRGLTQRYRYKGALQVLNAKVKSRRIDTI